MKIIDKTPLLDEKGELGFTQRLQGMMQFGYNWPNELQAQKAIINYFDRQLEKGYTLIRNYTLGKSGITVPIILLGPSGIHVIHVAYLKGRYEVRETAWNVASGDGYKPAPENLVQQTLRMANAVKAFIERQGVKVPVEIEPVLIAGDPGLHIESVQPAIRVLMIDGIKSYVANLVTAQPVLRAESVFEFTERLLNPHPPRKAAAPATAAQITAPTGAQTQPDPVASRAQAIFKASQEAKPFDPSDLDFAMDDELSIEVSPAVPRPAEPVPAPKPSGKRYLGMTAFQLAVLIGLGLVFCCILAGVVSYTLGLV